MTPAGNEEGRDTLCNGESRLFWSPADDGAELWSGQRVLLALICCVPELTARERIPRKSCLQYRWDGMGNMRTWRVSNSSTFLLPAQVVDSSANIGLERESNGNHNCIQLFSFSTVDFT